MADYLPEDLLIAEILPKLPAKSLLRFKSLSKFYKTLISCPNFANHHLRHSNHRVAAVRLGADGGEPHLFDLDSPETPPWPIRLPSDFKPQARNGVVVSSNGLLLISGSNFVDNVACFVVINPFTGFYRYIMPEFSLNYGFGYDQRTNDYKFIDVDVGRVRVYSLMNDSSYFVDSPADIITENFVENCIFAIVFNDHLCHWLSWCSAQKKHRIVCFDLCTDNWTKDIPLPNYNDNRSRSGCDSETGPRMSFVDLWYETCRDKKFDVIHLTVFEGCLSVLTRNNGHYDMWVMKEYRIAESWLKLLSVTDEWTVPVCYRTRPMSKVLAWTTNNGRVGEVIWYNSLRDEKSKRVGLHGVHRVYNATVFKGSLVTVPGGRRICRNE